MTGLTDLIIPALLAAFGLCCAFSRKDLSNKFLEGARNGLNSAIELLPSLVILMTAISMLSASGLEDTVSDLLAPLLSKLGIPDELVSFIIVRPFSGSGSIAMLNEIFEKTGADSLPSKCASVIMASSDTLIYVCAVYMSAAGIKKTRYTVPAAFLVMLFGIFLSCLLVRALCC